MFGKKKKNHQIEINKEVSKENQDEIDKMFSRAFDPYKEVPEEVIQLILSAPHTMSKKERKNARKKR